MHRRATYSIVIGLFIGIVPLFAQTSSLQGVVADPSGAVIPGAIITATSTATSAARKGISDDTGTYSFLQLPPGSYDIEVQRPGFKIANATVALQVDVRETLNVKLEIGQNAEVVNVTADFSEVNTQNATVGNPFNSTQVKELPLQTRNVVALLSLQPGVSSTGQVLGARADQNNVMLDGADVNDNRGANGFNAVLPIPLDSVQEFRTTIAGQGADQGHSAGGQVSIITKTGSNQFHGTLYEYNRNTAFEANDWFSNRAGVARPALIRNQYGASLGGPIRKNRLFFFANWEARKDRSAAAKTATVPSDTLRQGIVQVALKSGQIVQLNPADIKALDPLHIGLNPYVLNLMQQYPHGNNPLGASDKGLNFNSLLFNAPNQLDNHAEVATLSYNIDEAAKHTVVVRGTLNGATSIPSAGLAILPGYGPSQLTQDNSRGISVRYNYIVTPTLINTFNYGYTRLGVATTGSETVLPNFGFTLLSPTGRPSTRIAPTPNITDDITWIHGRHTVQAGFNFHGAENLTTSGSNVPSYSFSRTTLAGLGNDIQNATLAYIQKSVPGAALSSTTNVTNAFGAAFGLLNSAGATYNYGINGQAIPFGTSISRDFISHSPEWYIQDAWKVKPNITVTAGVRYSLFGVPYEKNGVEVVPQTSLSQYFADRGGAAAFGIPNFAVPTSSITYQVGGPVNNAPGFYPMDKKDWAPRLGIAYSPASGTFLEKIMGRGSVLRAGAGIVYDNYGNAMASAFSTGGSPGLSTVVAQPVNTDFSTGLRYDGTAFPALTAASGGSFPYTPPLIQGGFTRFTGVSSTLKAPYEHLLNANYARPLPKHMSIEIGYADRLAHRAIVNQDLGQPLSNFVDPKSGQSWSQAATVLAQLYDQGVTPAQVKANPNLIPNQPFMSDMFPAAQNLFITGSPSANLFYDAFNNFAGSWLDTLNDMDRVRRSGTCVAVFGCNTFFPTQNSGVTSYTNNGQSSFHALTVTLRRAVSNGWGYDFNYTLSHGIDNGSGSETSGGSALQDSFHPKAYMGPSDFDSRHQITSNWVVELPIGKGKRLFGNAPMWLDEAIGGWQVSGLFTFKTGTPISCSSSGMYNVNYLNSSNCLLNPSEVLPTAGLTFDQLGIPSLFSNTNAGANLIPGYPGQTGGRGLFRGLPNWNTDMSVAKAFKLPKESWRLQFRVEGYNALNHNVFNNPSLSISPLPGTTKSGAYSAFGSSTFGEITSTASTPRVLQMALRFEF